jgi:tRNA-splicing ligase RtcB
MHEKPIRVFAEAIEPGALAQFMGAMAEPYAVKGVLMPDAHTGYSLPIGAVVATEGVVLPAWVGYDIGCGMCAVPTTFARADVARHAKAIFDQTYRDIPVGFEHNRKAVDWEPPPGVEPTNFVADLLAKGGRKEIGSLGGGNHFIEIGADEGEKVWIVIHSGSRNVGHKTAAHYMRQASKLHTGEDRPRDGHYGFETDSELGECYLADMTFCIEFALANRREIMERVVAAIGRHTDGDADWPALINRTHNHAELKDGQWIHRKGATHAEAGMAGVIPGNMRDGSFIVEGKGNPDALWSSSHGAGRVLGRTQAKRSLKLEDFQRTMQGIQALVKPATLDESPAAYKDIFEVMRLQEPLVTVRHHIRPLINIKG